MMSKKKKLRKYEKLLEKYHKKLECVKIFRTVTEGESNIYGIITSISDDFLQLAENSDFTLDGELIIRQTQFESIRCNKYEKTIRKILKSNNKIPSRNSIKTPINIKNWNTIFSELKAMDIHVVVECENLKFPTFTIGSIHKASKKYVEINNYDASGKLDKKPTRIKYKRITIIRFNDRYSITFREYLEQRKNKENAS